MITPDMCKAVPEIKRNDCFGCVAYKDGKLCGILNPEAVCWKYQRIFKLKREYKTHYRTPPANYRDSENDLS